MDLISSPIVENFHKNNTDTIVTNVNQSAQEQLPETDPNENTSANSSLNKMESLLVEEDDDDGLGTESLRMSGSDEDGDNISPLRRKKRPKQQILESDDDEGNVQNIASIDSDKNEMSEEAHENATKSNKTSNKPKKLSALIDSDSEPENTEKIIENENNSTEEKAVQESPRKTENEQEKSKKKKYFQPMSSDSENDEGKVDNDDDSGKNNTGAVENQPNKPKKFSALIDSDSEPEETVEVIHEKAKSNEDTESDEKSKQTTKLKKKKKKRLEKAKKDSKSMSSDSEKEEETTKSSKTKSKVSDLVDTDSESSNTSSDHEGQDQEEKNTPAQRPKKPQRASAKKAMDEMQAIQSETQRLYRETQVNIPYHKPKRHTLKEFLTRRTIVKPTLNQFGSGKSLKMSPEELEEYAKQMEERAKEATEFFKSESDDEFKDIQETEPTDKPAGEEAMETSSTDPKEPEKQTEAAAPPPLNTEEIDQILQEHEFISQPTTQDLLNDIQSESEPQPSTSTSISNVLLDEEVNKPSPSSARPSALAELKRRLITDNNIPFVPKLKGDANMIIDFETGNMFARKPTGVENLFQRFIKSNKNNKKKPEEITPSQELQTTLNVAVIQESNKEKEPKPGAAYVKLKENLRTLISRKRKEEFQKKIQENKEEEDEYNKCCGLDDEEEEEEEDDEEESKSRSKTKKMQHDVVIDEEENEIELEEYENEEDEEDNQDEELADGKTKAEGNAANEDEPESGEEENDVENQAEEDEDNESDSSSSEEEQDIEDPSMRKHRVIKAFEDSDDEVNSGLNDTSTSVLYAEEEKKNPEEVENELLGLCSGQFAETQAAHVISQIPITQTPGNVTETELEDLCSGVFNEGITQINETQIEDTPAEKTQKSGLRIVSSDEEKEPDEDVSNSDAKKVKKLKKKKKKHIKLGFSDDEDDEEEQNSAEESAEEEEELPQTFIDYDSEENEIEVQMSKKDCLKQANTFLEKEAELSESEWGSADEDEQNLDKYDNELGDEDEFDQQKLHDELEQIHMRKVLDDDIREVKKIQEMLFDDEEADGVGRQRKFRWKNVESGFSLDDPAGGGAEKDEQIDSADDEEEMKWRKMRFEREQFLMQKTSEEILADVSTTALGKKLIDTMHKQPELNYIIEEEVLVAKEYKKPSFLIKQNDLSNMRNSVLNYDRETLAKIGAAITKSGDYERSDNEQVQLKASKTGNFVFAPLSEEEIELRKRKAEADKIGNVAKKMKTCTNNKPLFLDRLL